MLNPRPARIPETRDNTPGSFCTRQFSTCLKLGEVYSLPLKKGASEKKTESPKEKETEGGGVLRSSLLFVGL